MRADVVDVDCVGRCDQSVHISAAKSEARRVFPAPRLSCTLLLPRIARMLTLPFDLT